MSPTPTSADRVVRHADFATLTEALDWAAQGETGINLHGLRGEFKEAISYSDLHRDALTLAGRFLASGLQVGDRVGLAAETDGDFIRAFFACQYAGLVPAPLPLPAPMGGREAYVEQMTRMLSSAGASAVFGPSTYAEWLGAAGQAAGAMIGPSYEDLPQTMQASLPPIGADDLSYLQFSSGSTRFPSGVMVTHRALMSNAVAITRDGLKVTAHDRAMSWLPLYHDMGLIGFLLSPLACQMSVDLLPTSAFVRRPLLWPELMSRAGASISYGPTFGYELCGRRVETASAASFDLSRWRIAGVGGDMVRPKPLAEFATRFAPFGFDPNAFVASYGMAEATLAITMAPLNRGLRTERFDLLALEQGQAHGNGHEQTSDRVRAFARCGPALPAHELQIRDEAGQIQSDGAVGRVFVRGPSLMVGYFGQPEETARVLSPDGWLDTGDLGLVVDGELVPTGRSKDLILYNGRNIWPQDLEWTIEAELDQVRSGDVGAFAVAEGDVDEIVVLIQSRKSDPAARTELTEQAAAILRARHGVEASVRLVGGHALPQTTSGKLSRTRARALYLEGAFGDLAEQV